jgi:hypothetical protein
VLVVWGRLVELKASPSRPTVSSINGLFIGETPFEKLIFVPSLLLNANNRQGTIEPDSLLFRNHLPSNLGIGRRWDDLLSLKLRLHLPQFRQEQPSSRRVSR